MVTASQSGNTTYGAATPVQQSITIAAAPPAASFYLSGPAGRNPPALDAINPSSATQPATLLPIASGGNWTNQAALAQGSAGTGNLTGIGIRYRVYADSNGFLQLTDLAVTSAATAPVTTQLSSSSTATFCPVQAATPPSAPAVFNDLANPANSVLVYRTGTCGTPTDTFTVVPVSTGPSTALAAASLVEPVDVLRDPTSGAITNYLVVVHSGSVNGSGSTLGIATTPSSKPTFVANLNGTGTSYSSGDFSSMGVVPQADGSSVWLWRDIGNIYAAKITGSGSSATASAAAEVFASQDTDVIQVPAIVEYSTGMAYVALKDTTAPTNRIVSINTASLTTQGNIVLAENTSAGLSIELEAVAGNNLIYTYSDQSGLRAVAKTASAATSGTPIWSAASGSGQTLDPVNAPVVVGSSVYFCVTAANAVPQAYVYSGTGNASLLGPGQVLGGAVSAAIPAATSPGNLSYAAAIVANFASQATAANPYSGAVINSYDASGSATALGTLPPLQSDLYQGAAVSESPLQIGVPALLEMSGTSNENGNPANDLFQFVPGTAASLKQETSNLK